jgi:transposase
MSYRCITIKISESNDELLSLIQNESSATVRKRLLALQCYASDQAHSYQSIASLIGASRFAVSDWFKMYAKEGIDGVIRCSQRGPATGSSSVMSPETIRLVMERLADPEQGFVSFKEMAQFISEKEGKEIKYSTVRRYFRYGQNAQLKRVRPKKDKKGDLLDELLK